MTRKRTLLKCFFCSRPRDDWHSAGNRVGKALICPTCVFEFKQMVVSSA